MDYNDVNEKHPHLPKGAAIPRNQVAGHKHESRTKLGKCLFFSPLPISYTLLSIIMVYWLDLVYMYRY